MSTAASLHQKPHGSGGGGCCSISGTVELVVAFTAVCLALYGMILYLNYLYMRSGWGGVHRMTGSSAAARKRGGGEGLNKAALAAMAPVFIFKAKEEAAGQECPVCLGAMQDGDAVRVLPGCRHAFHVGCVDVWLCTHATCPVCRARPSLPPSAPPRAASKATDQPAGREPDLENQV
ncbi:RING-H2 finger protein ATL74-like [Lolium rigidum]|uniref:RING-H2 finger protein ATL74-like n=1 Tax=Lolium rigidum TaxID=89674 RepID=UPI001F5D6EF8|nr:RING-H2 finger protein ATL74-like [Lolium rigidum]